MIHKLHAQFVLYSFVYLFLFLNTAKCTDYSYAFEYAPWTKENPLKGFFPFEGNEKYETFPHSMEYFYFPVNGVIKGLDIYDWDAFELKLKQISSRGNQAIFRFYLDYPSLESGIPEYLINAGLKTYKYNVHDNKYISVSPDYENNDLRKALKTLIAKLAEKYDGDPRIAFIQVGLLGFWGEWHTQGGIGENQAITPSVIVQDEILDEFQKGFKKTKYLVRGPYGTNPSSRPIGYHDDAFSYMTIGLPLEWWDKWDYMQDTNPVWHSYFLASLTMKNEMYKWKTQPIGGEVYPQIAPYIWDATEHSDIPYLYKKNLNTNYPIEDFNYCVDMTHASMISYHWAFKPGFTGQNKIQAISASSKLGYEFYVSRFEFIEENDYINIKVYIRNTGVAPFYYNWLIELSALNNSNIELKKWLTNWNITTIMPNANETIWTTSILKSEFPNGTFNMCMRVINPLQNGKPLMFANISQNQSQSGYLYLGNFLLTQSENSETSMAVLDNPNSRSSILSETFKKQKKKGKKKKVIKSFKKNKKYKPKK